MLQLDSSVCSPLFNNAIYCNFKKNKIDKMIEIKNPTDCCGCTACASICTHRAITMHPDLKGFSYPVIDSSICVDCGLCNKVCPQINAKRLLATSSPKCFAFRTGNSQILENSSSGGAFYELASYVIKNNGVVCGVKYDENMIVTHSFATTIEELKQMQGSKYVQSNLANVYSKIKQLLKERIFVLFTGTPCQVAGLRLFLRKAYSNLLTVDLICHSVPSPMIFKEYVELVERKNKKKLVSIKMRDKQKGWNHRFYYRYIFLDGTSIGSDMLNCEHWGRIYFSGLITRPSCEKCKFTSYERVGDLTIADYWDDLKQRPDVYSIRGTSLVIASTQIGLDFFQKIAENNGCWSLTKDEAFQHCLAAPHETNPNSLDFWSFYFQNGFIKTYNRYFDKSFKNRLIRKIYKVLGHPII